ncbi:hypothetical protein TNCV_1488401 [Trichonephila clavipes]|nr:hypothetical protein TNCV_1488401 [Trichonephila clavipes]
MSSSPVPLKTRSVKAAMPLNLSELKRPPVGMEVVRRGVPAQVSSTSLAHGSKLRGPSPKVLPVAEQCDVNIRSLTHHKKFK